MDRTCPICQKTLRKEHKIQHVDFHCYPPATDHHYSERIKDEQDQKLLRVKVRLTDANFRAYLHVHYDDGYSEVWTQPNQLTRVRLDHVFTIDFSDINALKNKLRTYLLFS